MSSNISSILSCLMESKAALISVLIKYNWGLRQRANESASKNQLIKQVSYRFPWILVKSHLSFWSGGKISFVPKRAPPSLLFCRSFSVSPLVPTTYVNQTCFTFSDVSTLCTLPKIWFALQDFRFEFVMSGSSCSCDKRPSTKHIRKLTIFRPRLTMGRNPVGLGIRRAVDTPRTPRRAASILF